VPHRLDENADGSLQSLEVGTGKSEGSSPAGRRTGAASPASIAGDNDPAGFSMQSLVRARRYAGRACRAWFTALGSPDGDRTARHGTASEQCPTRESTAAQADPVSNGLVDIGRRHERQRCPQQDDGLLESDALAAPFRRPQVDDLCPADRHAWLPQAGEQLSPPRGIRPTADDDASRLDSSQRLGKNLGRLAEAGNHQYGCARLSAVQPGDHLPEAKRRGHASQVVAEEDQGRLACWHQPVSTAAK